MCEGRRGGAGRATPIFDAPAKLYQANSNARAQTKLGSDQQEKLENKINGFGMWSIKKTKNNYQVVLGRATKNNNPSPCQIIGASRPHFCPEHWGPGYIME